MSGTTGKKQRILLFTLAGIFAAGILGYCAGLFALNQIFPVQEIGRYMEPAEQRLAFRIAIEKFYALSSGIFVWGNIIAQCWAFKSGSPIGFFWLLVYFLLAAALLFLIPVPFALLDPECFADYFFPAWRTAGTLSLLFLILLAAHVLRKLCKRASPAQPQNGKRGH